MLPISILKRKLVLGHNVSPLRKIPPDMFGPKGFVSSATGTGTGSEQEIALRHRQGLGRFAGD
ncbi:hypothetical protein J2X72_003794 [Phyllobacterium sp. 1468]|nr:hypothetical protein [Phyllobacterium sp. 1468]